MFSYSKVQEEVLKLLTSSFEFAKTQDFITYIMNEGCEMQQAVEQLNTRNTDLMTECAIVIVGKSIYVSIYVCGTVAWNIYLVCRRFGV